MKEETSKQSILFSDMGEEGKLRRQSDFSPDSGIAERNTGGDGAADVITLINLLHVSKSSRIIIISY